MQTFFVENFPDPLLGRPLAKRTNVKTFFDGMSLRLSFGVHCAKGSSKICMHWNRLSYHKDCKRFQISGGWLCLLLTLTMVTFPLSSLVVAVPGHLRSGSRCFLQRQYILFLFILLVVFLI